MNPFLIPLNDWAAGERRFSFQAGTEFFQMFENQEILDADVNVEVTVHKSGARKVEAVLCLQGEVTVPCDRCLEPLTLPVDANPSEVLTPSESEKEWDLSQAVYDYTCLSLPLHKVHPEGECDPSTVRFLSREEQKNEEADIQNSPFSALKGLFDSK